MKEAKKSEIFIAEIDEKTLSTFIKFIYTGELEMSEEQSIQQMIYAVDEYKLPGFMNIFCSKMREETITGQAIADLLISAHRHEKGELREVAMEKIRARREVLKEKGFKEGMDQAPSSVFLDLIDLINDL